jgi:hypothetical protein
MTKKDEKVPTQQTAKDGWQQFEHWVYCPDSPGACKCKCDKPQ